MRKYTILFILLFSMERCLAQWNGNPNPVVGQSYLYSYNDGTVYWGAGWSANRGTTSNPASSGTNYYVTVTWTSGGSGSVNFLMNGGLVSSFPVTISSCSTPSTPSVTFSLDPSTCTPRNLSYTYSVGPPSGITWYWQTSATGTSTSNSSTSYSVTASGTYYVRAYRSSGNCWSTGAASYNVPTVTALPGPPGNPSASTNTCGPKTLSKNGTIPGGVTWYWQGTNPNGTDYTSATAAAATYAANSSGTYYIRARNSSGCWSTGSGSVTVSVTQLPPDPSVTFSLDPNTCSPRTLSYTYTVGPQAETGWFWQTSPSGVSIGNSSTSYQVYSAGNYYVRAYNNSTTCWSAGAPSYNVSTVTPLPAIPNNPIPSTNTCGPKTLSRNGTPGTGVSWYWQGINSNGTDYTSATATASSYTVNVSGTYFIRARNSDGCWSNGSGVVSVSVTQLPADPSVTFSLDASTCSPRNLSYTYSVGPSSGVVWYWQTPPTGEFTSNASTTYLAYSAGNYYVRAYNASTGCWSSGAPSYNVPTVTALPSAPNNPSSPAVCGPRVLSKNGSPPTGISWYWQGSSPNGTDYTSLTATADTYSTSNSGTYYIRARNSSGCWSSSSAALSVTVTLPPSDPSVTLTLTDNTCGSRTLSYSSGGPPPGVVWYWQTSSDGVSTSNPTTSYSVSSAGTYYVRARNTSSGCWSTGAPSYLVPWVNLAPPDPNNPTPSTNTCGAKTLSKNGTPASDVAWYWQGTNPAGTDNTSALAMAATYTASASATYYIRARTDAGCWSGGSGSVPVSIDDPSPPNNSTYQFCEWETMSLTASPRLANLKWYSASNQLLYTGIFYSPTNLEIGDYTYYVKNVSSNGCEGSQPATITLTVKSNCDEYINWSESIIYGNELNPDNSQKPVAAAKSYYDGFGNVMQSQDKSYTTNQVLASHVVYDNNRQPALNTLPAPINSSTFQYRHRFITNNSSPSKQKYSATDFDAPTGGGSRDNPNPVGNNGPGTLGWYYSPANSLEPNTPVTSYPYSRSWAEPGPDSKVGKSAGPGDAYRMGSSHETAAEKQKISVGELDHYYSLRPYFVFTPLSTNPNLLSYVSTSSTTNFTANQSVTIASSAGYINVTCNQNTSTPGVYPIGGTVTVTPGATYRYRVKGYKNSSRIANLYVAKTTGGNLVWPGIALPTGGIANEKWVTVSFTVPAGITSIKLGVLWSQALTGDVLSLSGVELYSELPVKSSGYKSIVTDPNGSKTVSFADPDGRLLASATMTATGTYDNWAYSYYNDLGQVVATIAPKGVVIGVTTPPEYVTYYHLGRVIENTSVDEGTTQYVYSTDGLLRFSQNQEQRNANPKRFSYTNYDKLGRLIESGEYTSSGTDPYVFQPHTEAPSTFSVLNLIDNIGFVGVSKMASEQDSRCSDFTYITYDLQAADFPEAAPSSQENLFGEVSRTENANSISWYSYDEFGQLKKSWQRLIPMADSIKTVSYTYDYYGNVTQVAYQQGPTHPDNFYHHYEYNTDQQLTKVETSTEGAARDLRAKYYYYLHGPLKRVELGGNVQGIDYVYNIDGSLKLINHADPPLDPGLDGISGTNASFMKDVFGEALDYNLNDYNGAIYDDGNFTLDAAYPEQFSGLVRAIRWHNHVDGHIPRAYAFKYDNLYQLDNAVWGNMTGSARSYGFSNSNLQGAYNEDIGKAGLTEPYDKNGNILGLIRKGKTGNALASYEYDYQANTNKLSTITPVGGGTAILSYQYNAIGQMTQEAEGSAVMKVAYNAYGLVKEIRNATDQLITSYTYDDRGDVLLKTRYNNGTAAENTFYVNDADGNVLAIYTQRLPGGSVELQELPVYGLGRFAMYKPAAQTVFYEISDHQGNVRNVIGNPEILPPYVATLEDNGQASIENPRVQELAYFKNISATAVQDPNMNHTSPSSAMPSPVYSAYLKWISGMSGQDASDKSVGPAIGLKVESGDKIDIETWAKFKKKGTYSRSSIAGAMASILGSSYVGTQPGLDVISTATQVFQNGISLAVGTSGNGSDANTLPYAYVYYLLYDRSFNPITQGWKRVSSASGFDPGMEAFSTHEKLTIPTVNITQPGYIYESENTEVWFDDLKIAHQRSIIVAGADYYPFGLPMENREITREEYRYGYQGQFSEEDETTGWNRFELRNYDASIGKWLTSDPYRQFASPYQGMGNAPHVGVDPNGGWSWITAGIGFAVGATAGYIGSDGDWRWALAGGVAGGVLGGVMFDQTINRYDVGTVNSSRKLHLTWHYWSVDLQWINSFGSSFNQLYRLPLKKLIKEKNLESPFDVLRYLDDNHPDLENGRHERLAPVGADARWEGAYTKQPTVVSGWGNKKWKAENFDNPEYTNPGSVKKADYQHVYGPQKIYEGRTLRIKNKRGVFYMHIHFQKP